MSTNGHVDLNALARTLHARRVELMGELALVEKKLEAVRVLLPGGSDKPLTDVSFVNLSGLTHTQALMKLATSNPSGHVLAQQAKKAMIASKLLKDNKNATSAVFAALKRCKGLHKVGRGEYALAEAS